MYKAMRYVCYLAQNARYSAMREYLDALVDLLRRDRPDSIGGTPVFAENDGLLPPSIEEKLRDAHKQALLGKSNSTPSDGQRGTSKTTR